MEHKKFFKILLSTLVILCFNFDGFAQQYKSAYNLGSIQSFIETKMELKNRKSLTINVSAEDSFTIDIESTTSNIHKYYLFGTLRGFENATIYILGNEEALNGKIIDYKNKKAFEIYTEAPNQIFVKEINIHRVVCIMDNWNSNKTSKKNKTSQKFNPSNRAIPELESLPGAVVVLYIDFDGENVSGGSWGTINAKASSYTESEITDVWHIMAEDFAPFTINVTTKRSVYDNAGTSSRQMVIFNETFPPQVGVAQFLTFNGPNSQPCWVNTTGIVNSVWLGANVGSHEAGHTFGLAHDGSPTGEYWLGHADYNSIMGRANKTLVKWNKGEYQNANNSEDDIETIKSSNNVSFRTDDHGNDISNSSDLMSEPITGTVLETKNLGIIEQRTDKDVFKITAAVSGTIDLTFRPENRLSQSPNLDIQARLLDASGTQIVLSDPSGMSASINKSVTTGTYYIEIDGVGFGDPLTNGYSDYGSLGQYFISGTVPVSSLGKENYSLASTQIYPNPSKGALTIDFNEAKFPELKIELINVLGKQIYTNILTAAHKNLNLENLQKGLYFAILFDGKTSLTKKIILR